MPDGDARAYAVASGPEHTVGELSSVLADLAHWGAGAAPGLYSVRQGRWLDPAVAIDGAGFLVGDRLVLGEQGAPVGDGHRPAGQRWSLVVTSGPMAGRRYALESGRSSVGRDPTCAIVIDDEEISRHHADLEVTDEQVRISDTTSSNGTFVDGALVEKPRVLRPEALVEMGRSVLRVETTATRSGSAEPGPGGRLLFNRPPRTMRPAREQVFRLDAPPDAPTKNRFPLAASLIPLVGGVVLALALQQMTMLLFAALSPLMAVGSLVSDRRSGRRTYGARCEKFFADLADTTKAMEAARRAEITTRRAQFPDVVELVDRAVAHSEDLWDRRPDDADFLVGRVGIADLPSLVKYEIASGGDDRLRDSALSELGRHGTAPQVPATVSFREAGVVGVCGGDAEVSMLARFVVGQLAVLQSPRDLTICVGVPDHQEPEWAWARWLPHVGDESNLVSGNGFAADVASAADVLERVNTLIATRRQESSSRLGGETTFTSWLLVVLHEDLPISRSAVGGLLEEGLRCGVVVLWLGREANRLPGACRAVVSVDRDRPHHSTVLRPAEGDEVHGVITDFLPVPLALDLALGLAPLRDVSTRGGRGEVPRRVSLPEVLELEEVVPERIEERWALARRGVDAPIGISPNGPFSLDMRGDGPHALVGGTTGAGKSELLQTVVAALATQHPPTHVTFVLVDYKGGAAFKDCVALPHTVGFVTDLDGHLVHRALVSLNAELTRREHILADAGAKDIIEMERRDPDRAPASLVIIVDEFAALAKELPEFVDGVVNIAQRGRSLGIHLILATQRPAGAINDNVRANTNLRIALRMNDVGDSTDVIDARDAADLPRTLPGRAYVKTGQSELTEVQVAYSGGHSQAASGPKLEVHELGSRRSEPSVRDTGQLDQPTDLQRVVSAINEAAVAAEIPAQSRPWLSELPLVYELEMATTPGCDQALVGLLDDPARQRQVGAAWDLDRDGSLLVYGTTGSGKTTLLRSLAVSLALAASPDELHLYALDFATRGLNSLAALPHCGGVIAGDDVERTQRVFAIVDREIALRKELFARAGVSSLREFRERQPDHPVARIVVLVDGWSAFTNTFEQIDYGELLDRLPQLIGDGRALGVHFVLAADRANAVRTTISGVISRSVVLRMADDDDYASLGLDYRLIRGAQIPPGRGFTDGTLEVQCALVGSEPSGPGQNAAIEAAGQRLQAAHPGQGVPEVRNLPTEVWQSDLPADDGPLRVVVGMRDVDLGAAVLDLADGNLLVTGPTRSGKTTALATIAQSTLASNPDAELYVLSPRRSELGDLGIWKAAARGEEQCNDLARRLAEAMDERSGTEAPIVIIVDDGHELADTSADASLARVVRRGQDVRMTVVGASESTTAHRAYSGWIPEIKKDRRALLLVPDVDIDGDLSGVRLPRRSSLVFPPGRGYLVERGQVRLLQVAL